jgi:hypothetical protein
MSYAALRSILLLGALLASEQGQVAASSERKEYLTIPVLAHDMHLPSSGTSR